MKDLLENQYHIPAPAIRPLQDSVFEVGSDEGRFILKRSALKEEKLAFICEAEEALREKGFLLTAPLLKTAEGGLYAKSGEGLFTLHRFVDGRRCDFDCENDLKSAAKSLALLSRCGGLSDLPAPEGRDLTLGHINRLQNRVHDLARFEEIALKEPLSERGKIYLRYAKEGRARAP